MFISKPFEQTPQLLSLVLDQDCSLKTERDGLFSLLEAHVLLLQLEDSLPGQIKVVRYNSHLYFNVVTSCLGSKVAFLSLTRTAKPIPISTHRSLSITCRAGLWSSYPLSVWVWGRNPHGICLRHECVVSMCMVST